MVRARELQNAHEAKALPDIRRFFGYRLAAVNRQLVKQGGRYFSAAVGLNIPECRVVSMLGCGGELSASQLAEQALLDPGQNSRVTSSLIERGIISVRTDPEDGRRSLFKLTMRGVTLFDRTVGYAVDRQEELVAVLAPDDVAALDRILDKLMEWSPSPDEA